MESEAFRFAKQMIIASPELNYFVICMKKKIHDDDDLFNLYFFSSINQRNSQLD